MPDITLSDILKDCAIEFHDPQFSVFTIAEWKRFINNTQAESYPRVYLLTFCDKNTTADKEYDLSAEDPEIREINEVWLYDDAEDTEPRRIVNWDWDKAQKILRLRQSESTGDILRVIYKTNLSEVSKDTDVLDIKPEHRTLVVALAVREGLKSLLLDRMKLESYRTTVDDQTTPYAISNTINMYDRTIEMRLREIKEPLEPDRVKKPYAEDTDLENPQRWVERPD